MTAQFKLMESSLQDIERFTDADIAFHAALLAATGNHLLTRLIEMIGPVLRFGRMISLRAPTGRPDRLAAGTPTGAGRHSRRERGRGTRGNASAPQLDRQPDPRRADRRA